MKLLSGSSKESQKRKRSIGKDETEEGGMAAHGEAIASMEGIVKVVPRVSTIFPKADI